MIVKAYGPLVLRFRYFMMLGKSSNDIFLFLDPPVQPKVAKDLAGNYVYYLPDKSTTEATGTAASSTVNYSLSAPVATTHCMEQVITLSPVKGGAANVVTINSGNILGRIDADTLNSLNQLLDEVPENQDSSMKTLKEKLNTEDVLTVESASYNSNPLVGSISVMSSSAGMQTSIPLPVVSSSTSSVKPSTQDISVSSNSLGVVNPVGSLSVTELPSITQSVNQSNPSMVSADFSNNQNGIGTELLSITQSVNLSAVPPEIDKIELGHNQESFPVQTKNSVFSVPSSLTSSILNSVSQTIDQSLVLESPGTSVNNLTTEALIVPRDFSEPQHQSTISQLSAHQSVLQNTILPPFHSIQSNVALSTYQPVEVFSTPSSQYQQSIMSTPKQVPQVDRNADQRLSYVDLNQSTGDSVQPPVFQPDGRCVVPQILTDVNMNNIQLQHTGIPTMYSGVDQVTVRDSTDTLSEQNKFMSQSVQTYSRNGYSHHVGLPLQSVSNPGPLYNVNTVPSTPPRHSQAYSSNLSQSLIPALSPARNTYRTSLYKSSSNGSFYRSGNFLSSTAPNPGHQSLQRHSQPFFSPRPPSATQTYGSDNYTMYFQGDVSQTSMAKSEPSSGPNIPRKLMPKRQMLQVKKHVSMYWPDFSNYPEVCGCDKIEMGSEIHIEQIWLHMQQMYYLPQIHILVIGCDEFVGILRGKKYYISVREVMIRLIPKFQKEVQSYLSDMKCEMDFMTLEELAYLKQRGCIDSDIHDIISLGSLRELCRCLLNRHSRLDSETNKLTEAATGIYYRKILEKHTRCSKCGGAVKCCDNLDRYEAIDCPVGITYKEQKMALLQREVIESAFGRKTSLNRRNPQQTAIESERIHVGRLLVGGTQFNTFKIKDKCFISLKELVNFKFSTLQVLQSRLVNLQSRPRPAPSCVDKYFIKKNIAVYNTLWIDTVIVRCMCCLGQQKTQMPLQKYFKFGDYEDVWDKEIHGLDDCDVNGVVFTLNPNTVTISNKRFIQRINRSGPVSHRETITAGPGKKIEVKPSTTTMRALPETVVRTPNGTVKFATRPAYREYQCKSRGPNLKKMKICERNLMANENRNNDEESLVKMPGIERDANLVCSSFGQNLTDQMRGLTKLSPEMDNTTEESILEIAAREAMLMPEYLNDSDGLEYPTSVDSVIQAIGMEDGLPSEEFVIQEIEEGGLNLFDGVLSSSICGESGSKFDDNFTDRQTDKNQMLLVSPKKSSPFNQRTITHSAKTEDLPEMKRTEIRKKRVPKRYEEFFQNSIHTVLQSKNEKRKGNGSCTTIKHNGKTSKQRNKGTKSQQDVQTLVSRNGVVNPDKMESRILNVIKHSEIEGITKKNQEEASVNPVANHKINVKDGDSNSKEMHLSENLCGSQQSQNLDLSATQCAVAPSEKVNASEGENVHCEEIRPIELMNSKENSPEVVIENNIESLCSPIKKLDNASNTASPNGSSSPLSDEVKSSRFKRVYDKVAALESSQDEYRILHMLATVAEVMTESGDEQCNQSTGSGGQHEESCDLHTEIISGKCDNEDTNHVKSLDFMGKVPTDSSNPDASLTIQSDNVTEKEISSDDKESRSCDRDDQSGARTGLTDVEVDPVKDTSDSKNSIPELYSTLISDEELSDVPPRVLPGFGPGTDLWERLSKFISSVNRYVDVIQSQREPGIQSSRIRFLKGAEQAFPGEEVHQS